MSETTFLRRLAVLERLKLPVIGLDESVSRLRAGDLPEGATVITIDDGWYGTYRFMLPQLLQRNWPVTVYVTTYYAVRRTRVFNVALEYLMWKLKSVGKGLGDLAGCLPVGANPTADSVLAYGESLPPEQREELLLRIAEQAGVDWEGGRIFSLVTPEEIEAMERAGIDVELHTHRHRLPLDCYERAHSELNENAAALRALIGRTPRHFCYPSGEWSRDVLPLLRKFGIASATTCMSGFNYADAEPLLLRRFLDSEAYSDIEFEAELCGVFEIGRRARAWFTREAEASRA